MGSSALSSFVLAIDGWPEQTGWASIMESLLRAEGMASNEEESERLGRQPTPEKPFGVAEARLEAPQRC